MLRFFKLFALVLLLSLGATRTARAFSLLGQYAVDDAGVTWQVDRIGYHIGGDIGGPMNLGEEFRWNTPIITYAFDSSFLNYFGSNGVMAVEQAIAILNALPPASQMDVNAYPFESIRSHPGAASLGLYDLKSSALELLVEELALAEPERWVWTLRDRKVTANNTITNWTVIQRNFDPITFEPTSYINNKLYIYDDILTFSSPDIDFPNVVLGDPLALPPFVSSVAGGRAGSGNYYTGLTYDDVGGLRYMLRTNNYNVEQLLPDIQEVFTNLFQTNLTTLDYALFLKNTQNTTNDPAQVQTIYNGQANITFTNSYPGYLITTNITSRIINYPSHPTFVLITNYVSNLFTFYSYEITNIVASPVYTSRTNVEYTLDIQPATTFAPGSPAFETNVLATNYVREVVTNGEFYFVPPTNFFGYNFISNVLTTVTNTTNSFFFVQQDFFLRTNAVRDLLPTYDLAQFGEDARTNDAATLVGLYPGLLILSSNRVFTNVVSSNAVFYFTNFYTDPVGSLTVTQQIFFTTNAETNFTYVFGNVVTNTLFTNGDVTIEASVLGNFTYDPAGTPPTNVFVSLTLNSNYVNGSIYIVPTNLFGFDFESLQLQTVDLVTNTLVFTNFGQTNIVQQSNTLSFIRPVTRYFYNVFPIEILDTNALGTNFVGIKKETVISATNKTYAVNEIILRDPPVGLRPGVDKLNFVRVNYDSGAGTNILRVTNQWSDTVIISNTTSTHLVRRISTRPDILFVAADLGTTPSSIPAQRARTTTTGWIKNDNLNSNVQGSGPGVVRPPIQITFSSVGGFSYNQLSGGQFFFGGAVAGFRWGSFDGTTNAPIVYPQGTSITDFEQGILGGGP
jgi:hypothetical protein